MAADVAVVPVLVSLAETTVDVDVKSSSSYCSYAAVAETPAANCKEKGAEILPLLSCVFMVIHA